MAAAFALPAAAFGPVLAQTPAATSPSAAPPASVEAGGGDLQAAIGKSNAYTALMNRTLRAIQSWQRYRSWVDMSRGPTGRERYISYGLYSLYDVAGEISRAEAARGREPAMPELDETVGRYIQAYQDLAPLITRAERYYERKDYRDDGMAEGRDLHARMVPAAETFLRERAALDAQMRGFKNDLDGRELAAIEKREGRSARWQVRNIMISARAVMDLMPSNDQPVVDLKAFDAAVASYAGAVREMDRFKENNPSGVPLIESQASSWLGKLRDFRDKLGRSRGDVRRGAANDANWLVNSYNTMVSLADTAMRLPR
ncbi:MAG: YiiG family protein [Rhizobiales bacterium]|nr:YiiG family protein [Hyphomicrobiales bacterium]